MKKWVLVFGLFFGSALAIDNVSVAANAGYANGFAGGLEASWDCILFQPKKGALRPTLDLGYGAGGFQAAFAMRHMFDVAEGVKVGGGVGVRYQGGVQAYLRGDAEYDLADLVNLPLFVGGDLGYAYGFAGAPSAVVAQFKAGYRF